MIDRLMEDLEYPPTDLDTLMQRLGIVGCEAKKDLPTLGALKKTGAGFQIEYSLFLSPERRRFTIAHELAHAIFQTTGPNPPSYGRELERLCDMLATEMLLPRNAFHRLIGGIPTIDKVFEVARISRTSLTATAIRCAELFRISTFEVEGHKVNWGYGAVRKGVVNNINSSLRETVTEAIASATTGNAVVGGLNGEWMLEWRPVAGGRRTIFLLKPFRQRRTVLERRANQG